MEVLSAEKDYWLFDWLERHQITDPSKLRLALDSRSLVAEMRDCALQWEDGPAASRSECNLVAGSGLGLYSGLTCLTAGCRAKRVDVLFRHAWHYFDRIYLPDAAGDLLRNLSDLPDDDDIDDLLQLVATTMYLRDIGAESLTRYYSSRSVSQLSSSSFGGPEWTETWEDLHKNFLRHPERYAIEHLGGTRYEIQYGDSELRFSPALRVDARKIPKSQRRALLRSLLADNMVKRHRDSFAKDILVAQQLGGSLGSTIWSHQWALSRLNKDTSDGSVFFQMELPSLQNVPVADLIAVRLDHRDSFLSCRTALRKAVRELSASHNVDRDRLANEVVRDIIIPETARLSQQLEAARTVLTKKSAIALTVAGVSTWVGVHFGLGLPASIGAGTLAAVASGLKDAASQYSEERRDLEISDMSFLWKALKCGDK